MRLHREPSVRLEQGLSPMEASCSHPMVSSPGSFDQGPPGASSEGGGDSLLNVHPQKPTPASLWSSEPLKSSLPSASPAAWKMS